jgi:hypothetical protein
MKLGLLEVTSLDNEKESVDEGLLSAINYSLPTTEGPRKISTRALSQVQLWVGWRKAKNAMGAWLCKRYEDKEQTDIIHVLHNEG